MRLPIGLLVKFGYGEHGWFEVYVVWFRVNKKNPIGVGLDGGAVIAGTYAPYSIIIVVLSKLSKVKERSLWIWTVSSAHVQTLSSSLSAVPNSRYHTWDCAAETPLTTPGPWPKLWGGSPRRPSSHRTCQSMGCMARMTPRSIHTTQTYSKLPQTPQ